ncbi:MAG: CDP-alcohol phosphatidyltransferase family protein [Patescibacteria group bacterium]
MKKSDFTQNYKIQTKDFLKIPNLLTVFRIFIAAIIFILFFTRLLPDLIKWLFVFGVASDAFDGVLARRLNQSSRLGVILEPIADTLLVFSTILFVTFRLDLHFLIFTIYLVIFFIGFLNLLVIYFAQKRWFARKLEISEVAIFFVYGTGIFYLFNLPYKFWFAAVSIVFGVVALMDFLWQLHRFKKGLKI